MDTKEVDKEKRSGDVCGIWRVGVWGKVRNRRYYSFRLEKGPLLLRFSLCPILRKQALSTVPCPYV